jgi:phage gpG-like protein
MIKIKVNTIKAQQKIRAIERKLGTIPWNEVGQIAKASIGKNFDIGGRYSSGVIGGSKRWILRKKRYTHKILVKSGELKNSFYVQLVSNGVKVGTRDPKAPTHNYGSRKKNIPARPFLVLQKEDIKQINKIIKKHLV